MTALGVVLLVIGAGVVVAEAHVPTLGMLGGPGVIAMAVGTVLAVGGLGGGIVLAIVAALLVAVAGIAGVGLSVRKGRAVRTRQVRTGAEGLVGRVGVVRSWGEPDSGSVLVDGAIWRARRSWGDLEPDRKLRVGDSVVVEQLSGLTLGVRPADEWELAP
jgi:membrane-bound serine protease (ClpP class)